VPSRTARSAAVAERLGSAPSEPVTFEPRRSPKMGGRREASGDRAQLGGGISTFEVFPAGPAELVVRSDRGEPIESEAQSVIRAIPHPGELVCRVKTAHPAWVNADSVACERRVSGADGVPNLCSRETEPAARDGIRRHDP